MIGTIDIDKRLEESNAKYMVELHFDGAFSVHTPNSGIVSLWQRDIAGWEKLYRCPFCDELVESQQVDGPKTRVVCVSCQKPIFGKDLVGETFFRMDVQKWAARLAFYLRKLEMKSHIMLTRAKFDKSIIEAEMIARVSHKGIDMLSEAREIEQAVYFMEAIKKDIGGGGDLTKKIKGFLLA